VDGVRYLRRDFSIDCDSADHRLAQGFAWFGIVSCSIGIPAIYVYVLWRNRRSRNTADHLAFFVEDYKEGYWFWEAIELLRKLLLTGFAALWLPGTLMQIITSMFVTLMYVVLIARCKPYCGHAPAHTKKSRRRALVKAHSHVVNFFALFVVLMTYFALFGALLVKFNSGFVSTGAVQEGYGYLSLQLYLIGTALLTGCCGGFMLVKEISVNGGAAVVRSRRLARRPSRRFARTSFARKRSKPAASIAANFHAYAANGAVGSSRPDADDNRAGSEGLRGATQDGVLHASPLDVRRFVADGPPGTANGETTVYANMPRKWV
jgi:hypothetical protein